MDDHHDGHEMGMGSDIDLTNSDLHIVQDVEEDLEAYTRLNRLGRFGEASRLFKETLYRHLGCFAVLAEHCSALLYQGNYIRACLVLKDSIARQEASTTGCPRFATSEMHFLRVVLTYVKILAETDKYTDSKEAKIAVSRARWYRDTITSAGPRELVDIQVRLGDGRQKRHIHNLQRQILLMCLRIFMVFIKEDFATVEDLQLPWSSHPSYPGQTLHLPADYLAWFEVLLPEHPWDACIVLQGIGLLEHGDGCSPDWSTMTDLVERSFPNADSIDIDLFARMLLLGQLCGMTLMNRWCMPGLSDAVYDLHTFQIVVDSISERLGDMIQRILRQHSGAEGVTETRPYKYLQLLAIDHEMIRELKTEDAQKVVSKILPRLSAIEKYAASSETLDHRLAMDVMNHQYIFLPKKGWRKTMLNKIARFTIRFGKTQETLRLYSSVIRDDDLFSRTCHPARMNVAAQIIVFSELVKDNRSFRSRRQGNLKSSQSILGALLQDVGDQGKRACASRLKVSH
jgi:hypothetical protein